MPIRTFGGGLHGRNEGFEAENNLLQGQHIARGQPLLVAAEVLLQQSLAAASLQMGPTPQDNKIYPKKKNS